MNAETAQIREGKDLIGASRPFAVEDRARSWWSLGSTLVVWLAAFAGAALLPHWSLRLSLGLLAGLVTVRMFILYHDFLHGAILRGSRSARAILGAYGVFVLNPPKVWRETHNYHHAHTAKLVGSNVGSYVTVNTAMWAKMSPAERLLYRVVRHPVTILLGLLTIFLYGMCLSSFLRSPRKHWDSGLALVAHAGATVALVMLAGVEVYLFAFLIPLSVACAVGAYLFYAQHNFPGMHIQPRESWSYTRAALESSSYMELGPVWRWFTGNIGYHHVHHLNPSIPFYRLPEAMAAIPELRNPGVTTLKLKDVFECFRLKVWDTEQGRMVSYREANAQREASLRGTAATS